MADVADLLVEIGTEELPPDSVQQLSAALGAGIAAGLARAELGHGTVEVFATPRRIAVLVNELESGQPERPLERRGPAVSAAFDASGEPTKAALGFASSCGVEVDQLERLESEKGSWLVFRSIEVGQSTRSLVPEIVERALSSLPIRRRMRWADLDVEFARPVHWVVLLYGEQVIEADLLGVSSGRHTRGHRFHQPNPLRIDEPSEYASLLYSSGHVVADHDARREMIRKQVAEMAGEAGGTAPIDEGLLEEVTALVEWPVPIVGSFDVEFLKLPACVLVATMKGAQRYFHVLDDSGALLPRFIAITNLESHDPQSVRSGNERVIRPRLKDAAFFYETDLRQPLAARLDAIKSIKFQEELGSLYDKVHRVSKLGAHIGIAMRLDPDDVRLIRRAGLLSKCDLVTEVVGEFPELQGDMGREYARHAGEPEPVAEALGEVYLPRFAGDRVPKTPIGRALAVADKLDTLAGIFAVGQVPSGDKDPFALRRAALGVLRILIEGELNLDLMKLIRAAAAEYGELAGSESLAERLFEFMMERLRAYFLGQDIPIDVFQAVLACRPTRPYDFARRARAVSEFKTLPEAASLAAANKRIQNILKQCADTLPSSVDETLFAEDAEWNLAAKLVGLSPRARELLSAGRYSQAMRLLAGFRDSVDTFFDNVKVMTEDDALRKNRLALLNNISMLFLATADISLLQPDEN